MILGFISLLLTFGQTYIVRICIPMKIGDKMLPCAYDGINDSSSSNEHRRKLMSYERRTLASETSTYKCKEVNSGSTHYFVGTKFELFY